MSDTDKAGEPAKVAFVSDDTGRIAMPLPDRLILRDATGQPWAITVLTDGQLQTKLFREAVGNSAD